MAKPRASTIQQRFGFMDHDLTTPKHDAMLLWLHQNLEDVVKQLFGYKDTWDEAKVSELRVKAENSINDRIKYLLEENDRLAKSLETYDTKQNLTEWEVQYGARDRERISKNIKEIGELRQLLPFKEHPPKDFEAEIHWEYPVTTGKDNKYIVGFIDLRLEYDWRLNMSVSAASFKSERPYWWVSEPIKAINFEVKTTIPSLGELVRQIQMYREYIRGAFVVVSPDDRFADALKSQNIHFLKYEDQETSVPF